MSLKIEGIDEVIKALENVSADISDPKTKKKILRGGGKPVVEAARNLAPKRKKRGAKLSSGGYGGVRYDTPKLIGKLKAPKGKGRRIAEYVKGNLAGSIRVFSLRKAIRVIIGPKVNKRGEGRGTFGPGTRRFDAYYAQMIFGSAKAFQRRVMIAALRKSTGQVVEKIQKSLKTEISKSGRKNGINVR